MKSQRLLSRRYHDGTGHDRAHLCCRIYDRKLFRFAKPIDQFLAFRGESIYEGLGRTARFHLVGPFRIDVGQEVDQLLSGSWANALQDDIDLLMLRVCR